MHTSRIEKKFSAKFFLTYPKIFIKVACDGQYYNLSDRHITLSPNSYRSEPKLTQKWTSAHKEIFYIMANRPGHMMGEYKKGSPIIKRLSSLLQHKRWKQKELIHIIRKLTLLIEKDLKGLECITKVSTATKAIFFERKKVVTCHRLVGKSTVARVIAVWVRKSNPNSYSKIIANNHWIKDLTTTIEKFVGQEERARKGFNCFGIHKETGTIYDKKGYNLFGEHKETGTYYNKYGYDEKGYNKEGYDKNGYNWEGYNKEGIHKETGTIYNKKGYNRLGYNKEGFYRYRHIHKETGTKYNKEGFHKNGIHKETGTIYNKKGYNKEGYDKNGFHKETGTIYNKYGYNKEGYDKEGYDKEGYNKYGIHENKCLLM